MIYLDDVRLAEGQ